jgi:hypothetical protein
VCESAWDLPDNDVKAGVLYEHERIMAGVGSFVLFYYRRCRRQRHGLRQGQSMAVSCLKMIYSEINEIMSFTTASDTKMWVNRVTM